MRFIVLISIMFLTACGADQRAPKKLYIDKLDNITENEKQMIYKAVERINQEAGEELISLSKKEGENYKPVVFRSLTHEELTDDKSVLAHARYLEYHCLVEMRKDLKETIMKSFLANRSYQEEDYLTLADDEKERVDNGIEFALLHELGHCLGFQHSDDVQDIMYPAIQPAWDQHNLIDFIEKIRRAFF